MRADRDIGPCAKSGGTAYMAPPFVGGGAPDAPIYGPLAKGALPGRAVGD